MSGGGGKGGSNTSEVAIPPWLQDKAIDNLNRAQDVQQLGYMPYYGADVAAFTPTQELAMQSNMSAAEAFGLAPQGSDPMAGVPQAQTFDGGIQGYSAQPLYEQALGEWQTKNPEQFDRYQNLYNGSPSSQTQQPIEDVTRPSPRTFGEPHRVYENKNQALAAGDKNAAYRLAHQEWRGKQRDGDGTYFQPQGIEGLFNTGYRGEHVIDSRGDTTFKDGTRGWIIDSDANTANTLAKIQSFMPSSIIKNAIGSISSDLGFNNTDKKKTYPHKRTYNAKTGRGGF